MAVLQDKWLFGRITAFRIRNKRKKKMLQRIKFFKEHAQSDSIIRATLMAEDFCKEEINRAIENYNKRCLKK